MKPEPFEVIVKFIPQSTKNGIRYERLPNDLLIRCKDCIHNVANRKTDPLDTTDYSGIDIVCSYFMTDGQDPDDFCSHGVRKGQKE